MGAHDQPAGGIRAQRIQAENVVSGVQIQGSDLQHTASVIQLIQALQLGEITADDIVARNVVNGLQYITSPTDATLENLRSEIATLRPKVETAITVREIADEDEARAATDDLAVAEKELAKPEPNREKVLKRLKNVQEILTQSAQAAEEAGKIGAMVIKLAPVAVVVWQVAQRILGVV